MRVLPVRTNPLPSQSIRFVGWALLILSLSQICPAQGDDQLQLTGPLEPVRPGGVKQSDEFFAVGRLQRVRRTDTNSTRMALLDASNQIIAFIAPTARFKLEDYFGEEVGITAKTLSEDDDVAPFVLLEKISSMEPGDTDLIDRSPVGSGTPSSSSNARAAPSGVQRASHEQILHEHYSGVPPEGAVFEGGSEILDGSYFDGPGAAYDLGVEPACASHGSCTSCGPGGCGDCGCGPPGWLWIRGEYLLFFSEGMDTPPLVTTGGATPATAGVLGQSSTSVLFGRQETADDERSGFRIRFGGFLGPCRNWGWEGEYFGFGSTTDRFDADTQDHDILARPFYDVNLNQQNAQLISFPGVTSGSIGIDVDSVLRSAGGRFRWNICCKEAPCASSGRYGMLQCGYPPHSRFDILVGYRYLNLNETLDITENIAGTTLDGRNVTFDIADRFATRNDFHGGEVGTLWEGGVNRWSWEMLLKIAFGGVHQVVDISGETATNDFSGTPDVAPGGILAQQSNSGQFSRDEFAVVPELGATLGCFLTPRLRATLGYNLVYFANVVRPGDQIDLNVDPNQFPPASSTGFRPEFVFQETGFWAQGLNIGLDLRW